METVDYNIVQGYGLKIERGGKVDQQWGIPLCEKHNQELAEVVNRHVLNFLQSDLFNTTVRNTMGLTDAQNINVEFYKSGVMVIGNGQQRLFEETSEFAQSVIRDADAIYQRCMKHQHDSPAFKILDPASPTTNLDEMIQLAEILVNPSSAPVSSAKQQLIRAALSFAAATASMVDLINKELPTADNEAPAGDPPKLEKLIDLMKQVNDDSLDDAIAALEAALKRQPSRVIAARAVGPNRGLLVEGNRAAQSAANAISTLREMMASQATGVEIPANLRQQMRTNNALLQIREIAFRGPSNRITLATPANVQASLISGGVKNDLSVQITSNSTKMSPRLATQWPSVFKNLSGFIGELQNAIAGAQDNLGQLPDLLCPKSDEHKNWVRELIALDYLLNVDLDDGDDETTQALKAWGEQVRRLKEELKQLTSLIYTVE